MCKRVCVERERDNRPTRIVITWSLLSQLRTRATKSSHALDPSWLLSPLTTTWSGLYKTNLLRELRTAKDISFQKLEFGQKLAVEKKKLTKIIANLFLFRNLIKTYLHWCQCCLWTVYQYSICNMAYRKKKGKFDSKEYIHIYSHPNREFPDCKGAFFSKTLHWDFEPHVIYPMQINSSPHIIQINQMASRTMKELIKACECVPRSGMPNNLPAAALLLAKEWRGN